MSQSPTISVRDIGPIIELEFSLDHYGLWVLRGNQGCGKSTALRTIQLATDGRTDQKPTKRDGTPRGEAHIAGKVIKIARMVREEGELTVDGLGDLSIADLHSPKYLEPHTRDKHRIKTLLRLLGVKADPTLFYDLLGGREAFDAVVDAESLKTDDLVEMAGKVKRSIERVAVLQESQLANALANMRAQATIAQGVDLTAPHDAQTLQHALQEALEHRGRVWQQKEDATALEKRAELAREQLRSAPTQEDVETAETAYAMACDHTAKRREDFEALQEQVRQAKLALATVEAAEVSKRDALESTKRQFNLAQQWRQDVEAAAVIMCPAPVSMVAAKEAVDAASAAVQLGVTVRKALEANRMAVGYADQAKEIDTTAKRLRTAAKGIQDVLTAAARIPGCPLGIEFDDDGNPRIVLATDRSDAEPFDELSDGERWLWVMRIAAGRNRLVILPQAAYGELSDSSRQQLHELAVEHECYLLSAQADDGELRGEPFAVREMVGAV